MNPELKAAGPAAQAPAANGDERWPDSFRKRGYLYETYPGVGDVPERVDVYKNGAPGNQPIFQDRGETLRAIDTSIETVKAMADLAAHRGWDRIEISGGDAVFQRASWMELNARGIETTGYKPNERDLQELGRRIIHPEPGEFSPRPPGAPGGDNAPAERGPANDPGGASGDRGKWPPGAGELIEHGAAPYKFDKENNDSYYARLRMQDGTERTLWGLGIGDAIAAKAAEAGDIVKLGVTAKEPVEVESAVRDAAGAIVGRNTIGAIRNSWEMEVLIKVEKELPEQQVVSPGIGAVPGVGSAAPGLVAALHELGVGQAGVAGEVPGVVSAAPGVVAALDEMGIGQAATPALPGVVTAAPGLVGALDEMGIGQAATPAPLGIVGAAPAVSAALDDGPVSDAPAASPGLGAPGGPSREDLAGLLAAGDVARSEVHPDLAAAFAQVARLDLVLEEGHVEDGERNRVVQALRGELISDLTAGTPIERPVLRDLGDRPDAGEISQSVANVFQQSGQLTREMMALDSIHHFQDVAVADIDRAQSPNAIPGVDVNRQEAPAELTPPARQAPEMEIER